ncbi:MAG: hypothetical protein ABIR92_10120 [Gemmatimonadaceae bacterium]
MQDPHAKRRDRALASVLDGPAHSDSVIRNAAANNAGLPVDLQALVAKIHAHAYRVTDEDVAKAQAKYSDDKLFEIIVSAAMGASRQRLDAGLKALDDA